MRTLTLLGRIGSRLLAFVRISLLLATVAAGLRCADLPLVAGILHSGMQHLAPNTAAAMPGPQAR